MNVNHTTSTAPAGDTSYVTRPGGRIGYDVAGAGPLVVLVPGMGGLRAGYRFLAPALRDTAWPALIFAATATATRRSRPTPARRPRAMSSP